MQLPAERPPSWGEPSTSAIEFRRSGVERPDPQAVLAEPHLA
jgi:hypothetical protein